MGRAHYLCANGTYTDTRKERQQNMLWRNTPRRGMVTLCKTHPSFSVRSDASPRCGSIADQMPERECILHPSGTPTPPNYDGAHKAVSSSSSSAQTLANSTDCVVYSSGQGIGDVIRRGMSVEVWRPCTGCRHAPSCADHHSGVVGVAFGEGALRCLVNTVCRPQSWQMSGEG